MSFAHVDSIDALKELRTALWKFVEASNQSVSEAEADLQRTLNWLEHDARSYWVNQIARRKQAVMEARQARSAKKAFRRHDGSRPSAIEEEKALARAQQRLEEAESKVERVRQCALLLQREGHQYRGLMQRFIALLQVEVPTAAGYLDGLIRSLEGYAHGEAASTAGPDIASGPAAPSMARAEPGEESKPESKKEASDSSVRAPAMEDGASR